MVSGSDNPSHGEVALIQPFVGLRRDIADIETKELGIEVEALALPAQPRQIDNAITDTGRSGTGIDDDIAVICRAVIELAP